MTLDLLDGPLDGFAYEPGANAGFGRNYMAFCAIHYTAGRCAGDRAVGLRGYFQVYIPREPDCGPGATCFAGVGRLCYHACEWNVWGPGIEFERLDDSVGLTQYQLDMGRSAIQQLIAVGIAPTYYDDPGNRIPLGAPISGFVAHRALQHIACDQHTDYAFLEEMAYMLSPYSAPVPTPEPPPVPPPPPDPNAGDDEMGLKIVRWADRDGDHEDNLGVDGRGNLFTRYPKPGGTFGTFVIAGPDADGQRDKTALVYPQVVQVVTIDGQIAVRAQQAPGGGLPTSGITEAHWNADDPLDPPDPPDTGSRWVAYALPS